MSKYGYSIEELKSTLTKADPQAAKDALIQTIETKPTADVVAAVIATGVAMLIDNPQCPDRMAYAVTRGTTDTIMEIINMKLGELKVENAEQAKAIARLTDMLGQQLEEEENTK
jgi:hypothetical protein